MTPTGAPLLLKNRGAVGGWGVELQGRLTRNAGLV